MSQSSETVKNFVKVDVAETEASEVFTEICQTDSLNDTKINYPLQMNQISERDSKHQASLQRQLSLDDIQLNLPKRQYIQLKVNRQQQLDLAKDYLMQGNFNLEPKTEKKTP